MSGSKKDSPFFISLANGDLQLLTGELFKDGFKINGFSSGRIPLDSLKPNQAIQPKAVASMINVLKSSSRPKKINSSFCYLLLADKFVFSKFLTLPEVKEKEIEATVYFKIKDFLPHKLEEMYLDWQPLVYGKGKVELAVVSIKRTIVDFYLKVCQLAGVLPLGFLPESWALANLAYRSCAEPNLIIYFNSQKVIFCFNQKGIVFLNTSYNFSGAQLSQQNWQAELVKAINFWQANLGRQKQIKKVYFSGLVLNEPFLKETIKGLLQLEAERLSLPVIIPADFPQDQLAKFIPLFGLPFSYLVGDEDKKRILLIPEPVKQERGKLKFRSSLKNILKLTSVILWGFVSMYLFIFLSLFFQLEKSQAALSGWEKVIYTPHQIRLEKEAANLNQEIVFLNQALENKVLVSDDLLDFIGKIPAGIKISDFSLETQTKTITLRGTASSRENILSLEKSLNKLGSVDIPLSSFEQLAESPFKATLKLK